MTPAFFCYEEFNKYINENVRLNLYSPTFSSAALLVAKTASSSSVLHTVASCTILGQGDGVGRTLTPPPDSLSNRLNLALRDFMFSSELGYNLFHSRSIAVGKPESQNVAC